MNGAALAHAQQILTDLEAELGADAITDELIRERVFPDLERAGFRIDEFALAAIMAAYRNLTREVERQRTLEAPQLQLIENGELIALPPAVRSADGFSHVRDEREVLLMPWNRVGPAYLQALSVLARQRRLLRLHARALRASYETALAVDPGGDELTRDVLLRAFGGDVETKVIAAGGRSPLRRVAGRACLYLLLALQGGRCSNCREPLEPIDAEVHHRDEWTRSMWTGLANLEARHVDCHRGGAG
jgi:hypothetical protein